MSANEFMLFSFYLACRYVKSCGKQQRNNIPWANLVNKPFQAVGILEDNARGWQIVERKIAELWNFEDTLTAKVIILQYTSKPEKI